MNGWVTSGCVPSISATTLPPPGTHAPFAGHQTTPHSFLVHFDLFPSVARGDRGEGPHIRVAIHEVSGNAFVHPPAGSTPALAVHEDFQVHRRPHVPLSSR